MAKQFYAVAKGRVSAIYRSWSLAKTQVEAFSCEKYVKCFSAANTDLLHEEISKLSEDKTYDRIVIVAGGDDSSNVNDTTTTVNSFKNLMETAISKADTVTVSSICPQGNQATQDCIDTMNAGYSGSVCRYVIHILHHVRCPKTVRWHTK